MNPSHSVDAKAAALASSFAQRPGPPMPASLYHPAEAGTLATLLSRLPAPVREAGSQVAARYHQLSTTQKVVGGALLFLLGQRLLSGKK